MPEPKRIHAVAKAAAILKQFPGTESLSLSELAKRLKANASSIYHIAQTLVDEGLLAKDPETRRYRLGPTLLALVPPNAQTATILSAATLPLYECSRAAGFDAWLAQLELDRVYYVARVDGDSPLKIHMPLLQLQPAHCVSAGRVMLAGLSDEQARAHLLLHTLRKMTPATCTDVDEILVAVRRARAQGWAETEGEHIEGASDIAVPVRGLNGLVMAAISIGAPSHVFGREKRREVLPFLFRAAEQTHRALLCEDAAG